MKQKVMRIIGLLVAAQSALSLCCLDVPSRDSIDGNPGRDSLNLIVCPFPQDSAIDLFDPEYRVVRPNGGEIFYVGEQCTVVIRCKRQANAILSLRFRAGRYSHPLIGTLGTIDPFIDTMAIFTVPDSFSINDTTNICSISDSCYIALNDYDASTNGYRDYSDCYFGIRRRRP